MRSIIFKTIFIIALAAVCVIAGLYWGSSLSFGKPKVEENSSIVVEKIEKVAKLITIESHLSEIYTYKDYYNYDWSFLRKKALVRVNAKVSAGYDLKKLNIRVDGKARQIFIGPLPPVEILSVDHSLDYFDIEEGVFNSFTAEDYNHINKNAKDYVRRIAGNSEVLKQAAEQENTMIDLMQTLASGMGYTLSVVGKTPAKMEASN
ncbi:MAG: DUF4230 domain-containing protein [Saprospiraceae bacterium]|nr:DUF4230 domain-containing protein [Saprospiraceae bacterium]